MVQERSIYVVALELKEHLVVTKKKNLKTLSSIDDPLRLMFPILVEVKNL